jgi:integrase/recombinase XerC
MPRQPRPWPRADSGGAWYAQVRGKQRWLAPPDAPKAEAWAALRRILAEAEDPPRAPRARGPTVRDVFNLFDAAKRKAVERGEIEVITLEGYERHIDSAADHLGALDAAALRPHHVNEWLDAPRSFRGRPVAWGPTTRAAAVKAVKIAFRWARVQGHVEADPIADMPAPSPAAREAIPDLEAVARLLGAIEDRALLDLITALWQTGCRPGEAMRLTADQVHLEAGVWRVPNKTRRTGARTRVVALTPAALELSRRLVAAHPEGPVFLNSRGGPWTRHSVAQRLARLRRSLGLGPEVVAAAMRHLFATDGLERGVGVATMAELLGHRSTAMVMKHYSKLAERHEHLKEGASKARPGGDPSSAPGAAS